MQVQLNNLFDLKANFKNHVLWIELHNPESRNAITTNMIDSLCRILKEADQDKEVRVIVLSGHGKAFSAGGDIKAMKNQTGMFAGNSSELKDRYYFGIQRIPRTMEEISKPVIAMVNGPAVGAGCDLSMMCDIRIGSPQSKFSESFTKMGLVPGDGGTFFLTRAIGYSKAMDMFLTGRIYQGKEALEAGLLNYYSETDEDLMKLTEEVANRVVEMAPIATTMTKKAMRASYLHDHLMALDLLSAYQGITQRTHDHFEAVDAFLEKRKPYFEAR